MNFDISDTARGNVAYFEHAGLKLSPVYLMIPRDKDEATALNVLAYIVGLLPHANISFVADLLSNVSSNYSNSIKLSIEFFKSDEEFFLFKYYCVFNKDAFWKQTLWRKSTTDLESDWVEIDTCNTKSVETFDAIGDLMTNVRVFDSGLRIHEDNVQRNIFEAQERIEKSLHNTILKQITAFVSRRPYATISETPKDIMLTLLRYTSFKEGFSNSLVSDMDIDNDGFIRFYSERAENGNRLLSYTEEKIRHFLLVAAVALTLHNNNGLLFVDQIDRAVQIPIIRLLLAAVCDIRTNKMKSQLIASVSTPQVGTTILNSLPEKPRHVGVIDFSIT